MDNLNFDKSIWGEIDKGMTFGEKEAIFETRMDEVNNARFCTMVKEMSDQIQFIFITHNKSTMELADILSGVTMREAGVSKLVSVNIKEAMELNANQKISQSSGN